MARNNGFTAANYPDENLPCRYPNHPWTARKNRNGSVGTWHTLAGSRRQFVKIVFDCNNGCGAIRTDILSATGERIKSSIDYSGTNDYVVKGQGRIDRAVFRRQIIERAGVGDTAE